MDSKQMVDALLEVDPGFERLCKTLFGDLVEPADVWDFMYADGISKMAPVVKANPDQADQAVKTGARLVRTLRKHAAPAATGGVAGAVAGKASQGGWRKPNSKDEGQWTRTDATGQHVLLRKDADVVWEGTFSKLDEDKRQAFGWASVVQVDGKPVVDRQGDWITPEEIEKAAYNYVLTNRKGGSQHKRDEADQPVHASDLIESFVVTPEKIEKMGLPAETPCGWWVGYMFRDEDTWQDVKKGLKTGFSIHGKGKRRDVAA
jgi:hypothetical protein